MVEMIFDYMDFEMKSIEYDEDISYAVIHCNYRGRDKVDLLIYKVQNIDVILNEFSRFAGMPVFGTKRNYDKSEFLFSFKGTQETLMIKAEKVTKKYL